MMVGNGESSINPAAIGGGVGGGLLFVLILFVIVVVVIIIVARSSSKQKDMRFTKLLSDMERMELEMAVTCKTGKSKNLGLVHEIFSKFLLTCTLLPPSIH